MSERSDGYDEGYAQARLDLLALQQTEMQKDFAILKNDVHAIKLMLAEYRGGIRVAMWVAGLIGGLVGVVISILIRRLLGN